MERTAIFFMCIKTQEMSSVTEMNSPQAVHHTMEGGLNVQTETGTENRGTDTEIWTEEGHERVMRDMR